MKRKAVSQPCQGEWQDCQYCGQFVSRACSGFLESQQCKRERFEALDRRRRLVALASALGGITTLAYASGLAAGFSAGDITACLFSLAGAVMLVVSVFYALDEPYCPPPEESFGGGDSGLGGDSEPASQGLLHSGEDVLDEAGEIVGEKNKALRPLEPGGPGLEIIE